AIRTSRDGDVALTANHVGRVDLLLRGDAGLAVLMDNRRLALDITSRLDELDAFAQRSEAELEAASSLSVAEVERRSLDLARLKDVNWAIRNDRLRNAVAVFDLAGTGATDSARNAYFSIQQAFAALDRMEVRGRDSALREGADPLGRHGWRSGQHRRRETSESRHRDRRVPRRTSGLHDHSVATRLR
ncbi:hypothetical protein EB008_06760, partial [bacterium]|nr:hypothetical protein [bacterium]